jgi:hypothetical protein
MGLGQPQGNFKNILDQAGIKNTTKGTKGSFTLAKHDVKKQAQDGLKTGQSKKDIKKNTEEDTTSIAITTGLKLTPPRITTRKDMIADNTIYKINKLIEEYAKTSIGSSPKNERVVNVDKIGHRVEEKKMVDDMQKAMELKIKNQKNNIQASSKIEPGTTMTARENIIGLTQPATDQNAAARYQAAQNHAKVVEAKYGQEEQ